MDFDDILDGIMEFFSFSWVSDIPEFFSSMFEGIGEFSLFGLAFGLISAGTIFFLRGYMLEPFLKFYSPFGQIFWGAVTYIGCFMAGYLLGKHFENTV